jgi:dTDP-4-dehydrorhamnose reductase
LAALLQIQGHDVTAAYRRTPPPEGPRPLPLELGDQASVARLLDLARPEAVVHAAVLGRADACESRPEDAERLNGRLPGLLADACRERGLRLVALSTDLVFDGLRGFVREQDEPRPLSQYGRTKRAGEQAVLRALPQAAVARVALVYGRGHGPRASSSESVLGALRAGRPITLYSDEYRTPVDPESVADAVDRILARGGSGVYHLGGPERLSRHELGRRLARAFELAEQPLVAAPRATHPGPEQRAADVSLDSSRARLELGWHPRPLDVAIRESRG